MTSVADPAEGHADAVDDERRRRGVPGISRNLDTAFFVTRAALRPMLAAGYGRVVNVASITGPVMAMVGNVDYGAAKAGMVGTDPLARGRGRAVRASRSTPCVRAGSPPRRRPRTSTCRGCARPWAGRRTPDEIASAVRLAGHTGRVVHHRSGDRCRRWQLDRRGAPVTHQVVDRRDRPGDHPAAAGRRTQPPTPTLRPRSACPRRLCGSACSG